MGGQCHPRPLVLEANNDDYKLHPILYRQLQRQSGAHAMDQFASYSNCQYVMYNSPTWEVGIEGVDVIKAGTISSYDLNIFDSLALDGHTYCGPQWPQAMWYRPF